MNETDDAMDQTWWTKWRVPAAPVILAIVIVVGGLAFAFVQIGWDRDRAEHAACENQFEFRSFMTSYLEGQVGTPVEDIPGFDALSPEARQFALQLAPIVDANREEDQLALARFITDFPIPRCD